MEKVVLEVLNLSKEINGKLILNNISFKMEDQISIAIRGQNGSGKSTLLKILAGIYEPTSGKIVRRTKKIGYVPEHFPENLRFNLKEYLLLAASFQGFSTNQLESKLLEYISLFEIESFINTPLRHCSKGTKQKVGLIQALLMKPDILLLDEPLTGLDFTSQQNLIQLLEKLKKKVPIIFTTHENLMIESIANRVLCVESGNIFFDMESKQAKRIIKIEFNNNEVFSGLEHLDINYEGNIAFLTVDTDKSDQMLRNLLDKKCSVLEVREKR